MRMLGFCFAACLLGSTATLWADEGVRDAEHGEGPGYGVRPVAFDEPELRALLQRVKNLESLRRQTIYHFVYELPLDRELVVRVEYRRGGVIDPWASGEWRVRGSSWRGRFDGELKFTLANTVGPHPLGDPSWYVLINDQYGYGFKLRLDRPFESKGASLRRHERSLDQLTESEQQVFAYEPNGGEYTFRVFAEVVGVDPAEEFFGVKHVSGGRSEIDYTPPHRPGARGEEADAAPETR